MAYVELIPHAFRVVFEFYALGAVFDFGKEFVFAETRVDFGFHVVSGLPLLTVLLIDFEVDFEIQVHVHLQVLLLRHHLTHFFDFQLIGGTIRMRLEVGMRLLLRKRTVL